MPLLLHIDMPVLGDLQKYREIVRQSKTNKNIAWYGVLTSATTFIKTMLSISTMGNSAGKEQWCYNWLFLDPMRLVLQTDRKQMAPSPKANWNHHTLKQISFKHFKQSVINEQLGVHSRAFLHLFSNYLAYNSDYITYLWSKASN